MVRGNNPDQIITKGLKYFPKPLQEKIILKPNLINDRSPPTTTPVETIEALINFYRKDYEVIVAEGSGWCETHKAFETLGYLKIAEKYGIKLVDLNKDHHEIRKNSDTFRIKEFEFCLTLKDSYLISVPILKEHSLTDVTISLKNMLGATLGEMTSGSWKKGRFHQELDESIVDINLYLKPDLAIVDGRTAGVGGELSSQPKELNIMILSEDLVAADAVGAKYLDKNPLSIDHLRLAQQKGLGMADLNKIVIREI